MFRALAMTTFFLTVLSPAGAQVCTGQGEVFLKNDLLADVPSGLQSITVVPGLCDGEAAGCVFDVSGLGSPLKVNSVTVGYGGSPGSVAAINVQIFDGITWGAGNIPTLGPLVHDFAALTGQNIQVTATNLNVIDLSQFNVTVTSGQLVVAFEMLINLSSGSCLTGYTSNFFTDNQAFGPPCNAGSQKNLIRIQGQGWRDTATATVPNLFGGLTAICPCCYNGNWAIRACVEPVVQNTVSVLPSPVPAGQTAIVTFTAPGQAGNVYIAAPTFTTTPGVPVPGVGTIPINPGDFLFNLYLTQDPVLNGIFTNFTGTVGPADTGTGLINTIPGIAPIQFYVAFVVVDGGGQIVGVSNAELISII